MKDILTALLADSGVSTSAEKWPIFNLDQLADWLIARGVRIDSPDPVQLKCENCGAPIGAEVRNPQGRQIILRGYEAPMPQASVSPSADARIYPCDDCGTLRSKNEGGTVFTICEVCWAKHQTHLRRELVP